MEDMISYENIEIPIILDCGHTFDQKPILEYQKSNSNSNSKNEECPFCHQKNYSFYRINILLAEHFKLKITKNKILNAKEVKIIHDRNIKYYSIYALYTIFEEIVKKIENCENCLKISLIDYNNRIREKIKLDLINLGYSVVCFVADFTIKW